MKKLGLLLVIAIFGTTVLMAQGGRGQGNFDPKVSANFIKNVDFVSTDNLEALKYGVIDKVFEKRGDM